MTPGEDPKQHQPSEHDEEEEESDEEQREGAVSIGQLVASYVFEGRLYESYQDMVDAKRKRNQQVLMDSGLLDLAEEVRRTHQRRRVTVTPGGGGGLSSRKQKHRPSADSSSPEGRRKSNRLAGIRSDGRYVEDERAGRFSFATAAATSAYVSSAHDGGTEQGPSNETVGVDVEFYRGRINDGSSLSIRDAVEKVDDRWLEETSAADAERFVREEIGSVSAVESMTRTLSSSLSPPSLPSTPRSKGKASSKGNATVSSSSSLSQAVLEQIRKLHIDNENWVSKVTPDRIYGIAIHPRSDLLVVCAGDKAGHVGIWKIPDLSDGTDASNGVIKNGDNDEAVATRSSHHLFRLHRGAASCLQWTPSGSKLYSASYDGTVRCLDAQRESFEQVFATYDDSVEFQTLLGHGMDTGRHYWTQYACLDTRFGGGSAENCLFVSTSVGTAMHLDLRAGSGRGKVTFHEELSEKKINTLR
jgi:WD40 repeat protein